MLNIQQVNGAFTGFQARPASHVAALAVLGSLAFIAHEGIVSLVPGALASALTVLFLAVAVLQWLALGRKEACDAERDTDRADGVITQAWIFGAIETALYAAGGLALLSAEGVAVYHWGGVAIAAVAGAAAAWINFRVKWVSCDPVAQRTSPVTGGTRIQDVLFSEAPALRAPGFEPSETARYTSEAGVVDFEEALKRRGERTFNEQDPRLATSATRDAIERFKLWKKRERTRQWREEKRAAA